MQPTGGQGPLLDTSPPFCLCLCLSQVLCHDCGSQRDGLQPGPEIRTPPYSSALSPEHPLGRYGWGRLKALEQVPVPPSGLPVTSLGEGLPGPSRLSCWEMNLLLLVRVSPGCSDSRKISGLGIPGQATGSLCLCSLGVAPLFSGPGQGQSTPAPGASRSHSAQDDFTMRLFLTRALWDPGRVTVSWDSTVVSLVSAELKPSLAYLDATLGKARGSQEFTSHSL